MMPKTSLVLHESSNVPMINKDIENMIEVRLCPSRSELIIQNGKQIQSKLGWMLMDIIEAT